MKKIILIVFLLCFALPCIAQDRVKVQVEFRKALWTCPKCGQEDITDLNVGTPSVYEHNCSKCGAWNNSFKEYNGVISYPKDQYDNVIKQKDIDIEKEYEVGKWEYDIKHPAPYIEPTPEDIQKQIDDKQIEIQSLTSQKTEAVSKLAIKEADEKVIADN